MLFSALKRFRTHTDSEDDRIARAYRRCFHTEDGHIVLEHLHRQTLFRMTDPTVPYDQLRFIEGQRQLVLHICRMATHNTPSHPLSSTHSFGEPIHG